MTKLTENSRTEVALFRYGILAPLISGTRKGSSRQFFMKTAQKTYILPDGRSADYIATTLYRWYTVYSGMDLMHSRSR